MLVVTVDPVVVLSVVPDVVVADVVDPVDCVVVEPVQTQRVPFLRTLVTTENKVLADIKNDIKSAQFLAKPQPPLSVSERFLAAVVSLSQSLSLSTK